VQKDVKMCRQEWIEVYEGFTAEVGIIEFCILQLRVMPKCLPVRVKKSAEDVLA